MTENTILKSRRPARILPSFQSALLLAVLLNCYTTRASYDLSVSNGPFAGGNNVIITNCVPDIGSNTDITNVLVGGVAATITEQGANWVTITMPSSGAAGVKDIVVQSASVGDTPLPSAYTFNPAGVIRDCDDWSRWTEVAGLPSAREFLAAGVLNGALYAVGGSDGSNSRTNVYRFNGTDWTEVAGLPAARGALAADVLGGALYAIGGSDGSIAKANVYRYNETNWVEVTGLPSPRMYLASAVMEDALYAVGGWNVSVKTDVYRFNGTDWTEVAGLPSARGALTAEVLGGALYAIGGMDGSVAKTDVYRYNGSNWSAVAGLPASRINHPGGVLNGALYAVGGWNVSDKTNLYRYNGTNWTEGLGLPVARSHHAAEVLGHSLYVIGGQSAEVPQTNVYRYPSTFVGTAVVPAEGSVAGGYAVTISGDNLGNGADVTNVTLCGMNGAAIVSQSATQIVCIAGTGNPGLGDVCVYSTSYGQTIRSNAFTYLMDHGLDAAFTNRPDSLVSAMTGLSNGQWVVGGGFTELGGQTKSCLGRLNPDSTLDSSFLGGADDVVLALAVQPDGKVLAGGWFGALAGQPKQFLGRLNADGTLDTNFFGFANGPVYSLVIQPDGSILVGGIFSSLAGHPCSNVGRLNPDGSPDTNYLAEADDGVLSMAPQADGKVVIGGAFTSLSGQPRASLGRLNANGSPDTSFTNGTDGMVVSLAIQADGKVLVAGEFTMLAGHPRSALGRLNADGSLDANFTAGVDEGGIYSIVLQADRKILVGGVFERLSGTDRVCIGRFAEDGSLDQGFQTDADDIIYALAIQEDGNILVGGEFMELAGSPCSYMGRLLASAPASNSLSAVPNRIIWERGGTGPEVWRTSFGISTDNGFSWSDLGAGVRIPGGWVYDGQFPWPSNTVTNIMVRGRGFARGGICSGSEMMVEYSESMFNPATSNYYLDLNIGSNGTVTGAAAGWYPQGSSVTMTAVPDTYYHFACWTGDASGSTNPLPLLIDAPMSVLAHFAANMTSNSPVPVAEVWLAHYGLTNGGATFEEAAVDDQDGDSQFAWEENVADTDPTNKNSYFFTGLGPAYGTNCTVIVDGGVTTRLCEAAGVLIEWPSATGRLYDVEGGEDIPGYNWAVVPGWTNLPATPPMNSVTSSLTQPRQFFRTRVRME